MRRLLNKRLRHKSNPVLKERASNRRPHIRRHSTTRVTLEQILNAEAREGATVRVDEAAAS